jgi:dihydroflavonol-4-reductase
MLKPVDSNGRRQSNDSALPVDLRRSLSSRRILVTGATGFIGTNLVRVLAGNGLRCRGLVRKNSSREILQPWFDSLDLVTGDTLDRDSLVESCREIDLCIHAAGTNAMNLTQAQLREIIVPTTRNLLEACFQQRVRKVVFISSCETIGTTNSPDQLLSEDEPYNSENDSLLFAAPYHEAEEIVAGTVRKGLDVSIVNLLYVMAPGDPGKLFEGILSMGWLAYAMQGGFSLSLVDSVVEALLEAAVKGAPGQRYMLAGENVTYQDFTDRLRRAGGRRGPVLRVPNAIAKLASSLPGIPAHVREILHYAGKYLYYDCKRAKQDLGYRPSDLDSVIDAVLNGSPRTPPGAHRKIR